MIPKCGLTADLLYWKRLLIRPNEKDVVTPKIQKESSVVWTKSGILMTIFKDIDNTKIDVWITDMLIFKNLKYRTMWIEELIFKISLTYKMLPILRQSFSLCQLLY